jgi:hypothetical protein
MLEILEAFLAKLTTDVALTALVNPKNMYAGPVDIAFDKQKDLPYPAIIVWPVSEASRTVPMNVRDTTIQVDIWSRNSQLELENVYEAMLLALNYQSGDQGTAHVFWQRLNSATDMFESDRRIWHKATSWTVWSIKP